VSQTIAIEGYTLPLDRLYQSQSHLWVQLLEPGRARVGMDPLGVETAGDLVQLALEPAGTVLQRGTSFGSIEAAKFVGPLEAPISGTVMVVNDIAVSDPWTVQSDCTGAGWLIEIEPSDPGEFHLLLQGEEQVGAWFAERLADYRMKGVIAG
jgi:glycine cleavage system H protein